MNRILFTLAALILQLVALRAGEAPVNTWVPLGNGAFTLPEKGWPNMTGPALMWLAPQDMGVVVPLLTENELKTPSLRKITVDQPQWTTVPGKAPGSPDVTDSPRSIVYLPGLNKILYLKQEWYYSQKVKTNSWLIDPQTVDWEPIPDNSSFADKSTDFNPSAGRDGQRVPIWGSMCYDAHNKEALAFGGGGTWGRVGREPEKVNVGDWFFDEATKRVRRILPDEKPPAQARKWFPGHCGTWLFSEAEKKWRALEQPMGQQPSGRILPGLVYDAAEKKIVLFGGDDLARCFNDTWVYDCVTRTWKEVRTSKAPQARAGHAMVYDPEQKAIIMTGGYAANWKPLKDTWVFSVASGTWTAINLDLPEVSGMTSGDYDPKRKQIVLAAYPRPLHNKTIPVYTLKLDLKSVSKVEPPVTDPKMDYHCKGKGWGSRLPDEYLTGNCAPGDPAAGRAALAALPANTWVVRKPPYTPPGRDWGSNIYDVRTHKGYAWGGGHSTYPGADVIEYDLFTDRWTGMADPVNFNPVWLHGMVSGPPGVSLSGWSLLPTHSRKSYGIDPVSNSMVTYVGDVYDLKHHMFRNNTGTCPGKYGVSSQVSFCTTPHGLYGYSTGTLARVDVAAGKWEVVALGGPKHDEHGHMCHDSKRNRFVYFERDTGKVWVFDIAAKTWTEEKVEGSSPKKQPGDSTYIPELDAALLIIAEEKKGPEKLFFYKLAERKWYSAPYVGEAFDLLNAEGRDFSPIYDPELKLIVRIKNVSRMNVSVMRLDPTALKLDPLP